MYQIIEADDDTIVYQNSDNSEDDHPPTNEISPLKKIHGFSMISTNKRKALENK